MTNRNVARVIADDIPDTIEDELARENDPAKLGWPHTLPIEVALRTATIPEICKDYNISREEWNTLRLHPGFIAEVAGCMEALKKEGVSFSMKAKLQAEELLKTSWRIIHDKTSPAQVKADLIKSTMRWAGYDAKDNASAGQANNLQINIVL